MKDLIYRFYIGGTPEQVWNALTNNQSVKKIYNGSEIRSSFEPGSSIQYVGPGIGGPETVHVQGTILAFNPNQIFSHTSKIGEAYGVEHKRFESRVTYLIEPAGNCTRLILTHDRWMDGDPCYENTANDGWWKTLSSLKSLVETGNPLEYSAKTNP